MYESAYCIQCHRDTLPVSFICNREAVADNGPVQEDGIDSRYEAICLRCCGHNHG